jgi:uncharacterized repeat protein (TIGR03803 family)
MAADEHVLYAFTGRQDGAEPVGSLSRDEAGDLYGATAHGGTYDGGVVFRLSPDGTETVIHAFSGETGGAGPFGGVIRDKAGNFYGIAAAGGSHNAGLVFKLAPDGTETVLHEFAGENDGAFPESGLFMDKRGNIYGTTEFGGPKNLGTVFEITAKGKERVLYAFRGSRDGSLPFGRPIKDKLGNLYGTTYQDGPHGAGEVFKLTPDGVKTVLHAFTGGSDGGYPVSGLLMDKRGNFYGTTYDGGGDNSGTIFEIDATGKFRVLYSVEDSVGFGPVTDLIMDRAGTLYGSISDGGSERCTNGCGTSFKLAADGTFTILHAFSGRHDGSHPNSLLMDDRGNLYGTTALGGRKDHGTIFVMDAAR